MIGFCDRSEKDHLMSRYRAWALAIVVLALAGEPVFAQTTIVYEFANATTGLAQSVFAVPVGQKVPVRIYLHETTPGAPLLSDSGHGLGSGGVRLTYIPATTASIAVLSDAQPA